MAIDRSKFKASSVAKVQQTDSEANRITGKGQRSRADVLEIEEGRNRFRIYPVHPGNEKDGEAPEEAVYAEPCSKVFLPVWIEEKDKEGNVVMEKGRPKMKKISKPIFNSKLHGGTPKDLVEEYIRLAKEKAEQIQDKTEKQNLLDKIYGKYNANPNLRLPGCNYQNTAVMYADKLVGETDKSQKFGRLEVKTTIKDQMNKKAALETADDPLGVDPYSDPTDGLPVIIVSRKPQPGEKLKPADYYQVDIDKRFGKDKRLIEYPLSDEQLEKFLTYPPLWKLFRNSFKRRDFEMQLQGLQNFDEEYEIGIYETEEFASIVEEIDAYYPENDEEENTQAAVEEVDETEEDTTEVEQTEQDELDLMNRVELKNYNVKNKLGIQIKPAMSDDVLRNEIRKALENKEPIPHIPLPGEAGYKEDKKAEEKKADPKPATTSGMSARDRLAALRKK